MPNEPIYSPRMHHPDDRSLSLNTLDNSILDSGTLDTQMSPNGALPMFSPPHRSPPMSPAASESRQSSRSRRSSPLRSRRPDFRPPKEPVRYNRSGIVGDMMRERSPEESVSSSVQRRYRFRVGSRRGDFVDPPAAVASPRQRRSGETSQQKPNRSPPRREDSRHDLSSSSQSLSRGRAPTKRLDMRYDDDEFAYVAHMIMLHIQRQQELDVGCASLSEFFDLFNFFQAPTSRRIESQELNEDLLAEFRFALKHRLKQISLQIPKNRKEDEVTKLTRQVSKIISLHGYPKLKRKKSLPREDPEFIVLAIGGDEDNTTHTSETTISNISPVIVEEEEKEEEDISGAANEETAKHEETKPPRSPTFPVPPEEAFKLPAFVSTPKREAPDAQVESPKQHFFSEDNTLQQQPQDPYNHFQHDPNYSQASSAQYQTEANPYQSPQHHSNSDYIRQQYQQHLQQQQQHHFQEYEEEPVFEIVGNVYAPVVDAYYEDPEPPPNFLDPADRELSQNLVVDSPHEIYVGIDRSFEEEAVVMRELDHIPPSYFPMIAPDGSITENLVVPSSPPLSPNRSMLRLHLKDEAKRVTNMMNVTSNYEVRQSCQNRMNDIRSELERLTLHCEDSTRTSSNESQSRLMVDVMAEESSEEEKMSMREESYSYRNAQARLPARNDRVVHVMAPSNLPQAYEFEAQLGNQNLTATVPKGGVKKGQVFEAAVSEPKHSFSDLWDQGGDSQGFKKEETEPTRNRGDQVFEAAPPTASWQQPTAGRSAPAASDVRNPEPVQLQECDTTNRIGQWSDKLLDCFRFGPCHGSILLSIWLPLMALGQVMTRMQALRWIAMPCRRKDSFRVSIVLTMFWITVNCLIFYLPIGGVSKLVFFLAVNGALYFYLIINVIRTRRMLRKMYGIPTGARPMNDVLVGSIIPQLALMQMLRHTCDYDTYSGQCCTRTGLPQHVEILTPVNVTMDKDDGSISTMYLPFQF